MSSTPALAFLARPALLFAFASILPAGDWPQWRGANQDGISEEKGILPRWPKEGPREIWRMDLGAGFSSFAAVGGKLFTLAEREGKQRALCLEATSGKILWSTELEGHYAERQGGDGPRATPAVREGTVYVLAARGTIAALDADNGRPAWKFNILQKWGAENLTWGMSASPFLDGERLIVPVGTKSAPVVALDRKSGEPLWKSESDGHGDLAGYSTPLLIERGGKRELVILQGRAVVGLDPETGKKRWSYPWRTSFDVNASAPVYRDGLLFVSTGYNVGAALLRLPEKPGEAVVELWRSKVFRNKFASCILLGDHLYGFDESNLKCVELRTGKEMWRQSRFGHGTLLAADGHLIALSDSGDLVLARATAEGYQEEARKDGVLKSRPAWTVPVLHNGVLFLRDSKEAVALRIADERK